MILMFLALQKMSHTKASFVWGPTIPQNSLSLVTQSLKKDEHLDFIGLCCGQSGKDHDVTFGINRKNSPLGVLQARKASLQQMDVLESHSWGLQGTNGLSQLEVQNLSPVQTTSQISSHGSQVTQAHKKAEKLCPRFLRKLLSEKILNPV